jgi:enoyl-CoA hydratase
MSRTMALTCSALAACAVAAVEGYALAGGTELALAKDLIVASKDSVFVIPEQS